MLKVFSHCSRVLVNRLPPPPIPALLNRRSILSVACCSQSSSRKRLSWSSLETSAMWVVTRRPCGSFSTSQSRLVSAIVLADTSHIATLQPSATSWRASSRPMPVPPPVMTAVFPAKTFMRRCSPLLLVLYQDTTSLRAFAGIASPPATFHDGWSLSGAAALNLVSSGGDTRQGKT